MKQRFQKLKTWVVTRKREIIEFFIALAIVVGLAGIVFVIVLLVRNAQPKIDFPPSVACELLTKAEATEFLGDRTVNSTATAAVISDNTATSRCGYTDANPDTNSLIVAALIVRSAVNDNGIKQNQKEFAQAKPVENVQTIKDLGEGAYFNEKNGQLNVLNGHNWIILSFGLGSAPNTNDVDKLVEVARKTLI